MNGLNKRGGVWHFDFWFRKKRYQGSTRLRNHEKAKMFIAKLRSDLALGLVGLAVRPPAPPLKDFLRGAFTREVNQNVKKHRTKVFYLDKVERLLDFEPFTRLRVDAVDELAIQDFKEWRSTQVSKATINGELRTLRKAMIFAKACKLIPDRPLVRTLPGEKGRDFILTGEMETEYLSMANYPLRHVAILILDLGLRPEEALSLKKVDVADDAVTIWDTKTPDGRRAIPQTDRTVAVFKEIAEFHPDSPWVFPGRKGKHLARGSVDNLHTALRKKREWPETFVLYSCRHTFATRLSESTGGDVFMLKEALGHTDIRTCQKYVHPRADRLRLAMKQKELLDRAIRGESEVVTTKITTDDARDGGNPRLV